MKLSKIIMDIIFNIPKLGVDEMATGKSKKGIVGKVPMASKRKGPVGEGIDIMSNNLTNAHDIDKTIKNRKEN
jgi:hypothetical protein